MNAELEALILAWDAFLDAADKEAWRLKVMYDTRFEEAHSKRPGTSAQLLQKAIESAHRDWRRAQKKPSSLPPKA